MGFYFNSGPERVMNGQLVKNSHLLKPEKSLVFGFLTPLQTTIKINIISIQSVDVDKNNNLLCLVIINKQILTSMRSFHYELIIINKLVDIFVFR